MIDTAKQSKWDKHAARIFHEVFRRQFPAVKDVERLASEIDRIVEHETQSLRGDLDRAKREVQSLTRRLATTDYDGPVKAGEHKRKPRLRAMAERSKA